MDTMYSIKNLKVATLFNGKEIPADILADLLSGARATPTKTVSPNWKFVVIKSLSFKKQLASITDLPYLESASVIIALFSEATKFAIEYSALAAQSIIIGADHYNIGSNFQPVYHEPYAKKIEALLNAPSSVSIMSLIALGYYDYTPPTRHTLTPLSQMIVEEKF